VVVPLEREALGERPETLERRTWLEGRRRDIPATIRILLDATTTCREGVTPVGLEVTQGFDRPETAATMTP